MNGRSVECRRAAPGQSRLIMPEPKIVTADFDDVMRYGVDRERHGIPPIAGGMDFYEISFSSASVTAAAVMAEILNTGVAANPRMRLSELDVFWLSGASTTISVGLGRPGNTPAGGAATVAVADDPAAPAAFGGYIVSGWTTAPTIPAKYIKQAGLASSGGNGAIWTWPMGGEVVIPPAARNNGLVLWCTAIGSATATVLTLTARWTE